jgi:RNA polymerase sigma-70 factor (ECF subfamily)
MPISFSHIDQDPDSLLNIKDIDTNLIIDLQENGDMEAFKQIMNKYNKIIYGFCFRYTGNREDAEDLSQDVFIKVYRNISSFRRESKFSTWLYRLAVNTCLNHIRWQKHEKINEMISISPDEKKDENRQSDIRDHAANPEQEMLNKELGMIINKTVAQLNYKQRSVLILKDFQGRSYEEIAEIMNMNTGTVRSTLSRGRLNVAKQIKEYYKL